MSLRDEFEKFAISYNLDKQENGHYADVQTRCSWVAYQSATERALRIGLDVHAWASARNLDWRTVMTEYERRIKGDSNG